MNPNCRQISVAIPTMNRSDFISRLLCYYADAKFEGVLLIGDSSNADHLERTQKVITRLKGRLNIEYHLYPNKSEPEVTAALISNVKTRYVAWLPDDDFLTTNGLIQCASFLEKNPDYSVAHGISAIMTLEKSGPFGRLNTMGPHRKMRDISQEKAQQRLLDQLTDYLVLSFGLHRTLQMKEAYSCIVDVADKGMAEILAACFFVLQGKIKALDCFYLVRQEHDQRYLLPNIYDWMIRAEWFSSYQVFYDRLTEKLASQDGLSKGEAGKIVRRAFGIHLAHNLPKWEHRHGEPQENFVKRFLKNTPGVSKAWQQMRSFFPNGKFLLPALLRPSSPYYGDFMPIYRSITEEPPLLS